jgi:hypothetical protein
MASWKNDHLILFHGCTEDSLRSANPRGIEVGKLPHEIDISVGNPRAEFGQGFYGTTWLHQAKSWANLQARKITVRSRGKRTPKAVVLRFDMSRDELADLEALVFTNENTGFWPFISYCRAGLPPHGRSKGTQQKYDIIYGPVSIWPQQLVIKDSDQVSFHTKSALNAIPPLVVIAVGNPYIP